MPESCVLDPVEFIPERVELDLHSLGLEVRAEGVDWGESTIEAQMVRRDEGEASSDGHRPGIPIRIPLRVMEEGAVSLAEAAHRLQAKIGTHQREGGWIRRDFDEDGGFAGSLGYQIIRHTASISGLQGWLFAHRHDAPDVVITATRMPIGYSTEEEESGPFSTTTARQLVYTLPASEGTAEGLRRIRVTNNNSSGDWRGLIWAEECRDYKPGDATAEPVYLAKSLTPSGGAEVKSVSGAEVVQHTGLTAGWSTILSSKITASGHMTHRGGRRIWMRIFDPGAEAGNVQLRLFWRALGSSRWTEDNSIVSTYAVGNYSLVDLGSVLPQAPLVGGERWEFALQARALSGSGSIRIRDVYPLPTEQYAVLSESGEPAPAGEPLKAPGTVEDAAGVGTEAWSNPGNAKAVDGAKAYAVIGGVTPTTHYLKATNFAFSIPEGAMVRGIRASVLGRVDKSALDARVRIVKGGEIKATQDKAKPFPEEWLTILQWREYGGVEDLWGLAWTPADVNAANFGVAVAVTGTSSAGLVEIDAIRITLFYAEAAAEDRVCYASKKVELRSDGAVRQASEGESWGISIPDGFLPYAPASGLEARDSRGILIPTQGDLGSRADAGTPNKISMSSFARDGYHVARGSS